MTLAEVPVVAPVAIGAELALALVLVVSALLTLGLLYIFDYTIGLLLRLMAGLIPNIPWVGGIAKGAILAVDHNIRNRMVGAARGQFMLAGRLFHGAEQLTRWSVDSLIWFGRATYQFEHALVHSWIPGILGATVGPVTKDLGRAKAAGDARARAEAKARAAGIEAGVRDLTNEKIAREHGIDRVRDEAKVYTDTRVGAVQGSIAAERDYSHRVLGGRLGFWERILGIGAIGGIALAVLTRVFPFWQCSNVRRFMRGLCRSPLGALDWLFGLAALVVVALKPVQIAHLGQDAVGVLDTLFRDTIGHTVYAAPVTDWQESGRYAPHGS